MSSSFDERQVILGCIKRSVVGRHAAHEVKFLLCSALVNFLHYSAPLWAPYFTRDKYQVNNAEEGNKNTQGLEYVTSKGEMKSRDNLSLYLFLFSFSSKPFFFCAYLVNISFQELTELMWMT